MVNKVQFAPANTDDAVDVAISECLDPKCPRSFFLYAGAGSGKTYSLVEALKGFSEKYEANFKRSRRQVAVITYTNAACDEIIDRVQNNSLFHISTIHSFCWLQIQNFHEDIRQWLISNVTQQIAELEIDEAKGRAGTKASIARQRSIIDKTERLNWLSKKREFTYNPNGDNIGKASLSHSEVLKICAYFIVSKPSFQSIIVNRYPFILIDESQDTNKELIEAFFSLEVHQKQHFGLGLFGDMMQRIYGDGKHDLGENIPESWATPIKKMNRRSPSRIVALANDIRANDDKQQQKALEGKSLGSVRLFIAPQNTQKKDRFEADICSKMAQITNDPKWEHHGEVKQLMLEHLMASVRMHFSEMFEALSNAKSFSTGLRSGDLPSVRFFSDHVQPLLELNNAAQDHALITHLRKVRCPLLMPDQLKDHGPHNTSLNLLKLAVTELTELVNKNKDVSFQEVLTCIATHNLLAIPASLSPFAKVISTIEEEGDEEEGSSKIEALQQFLETPYKQIVPYKQYVTGNAPFDTHQGVKGLEFERVLVIMDDSEANGFLFSYEKMFEVSPPTPNDLKRQANGEDTGMARTRRLFYVTCTRAKESLALIAYTEQPNVLKQSVLAKGWFTEDEIELTQ